MTALARIPGRKALKPRPPINTARKLAEARAHLGIGKIAMAAALRLKGDKAYQTIRRMETGTCPVPGPVQVAVEAMLGHAPKIERSEP